MPLSQDDPNLDYDGSWGDASEGWPSIHFDSEDAAVSAHTAAWRDAKVPYGSYVLVGRELRLETAEYVRRMREVLAKKATAKTARASLLRLVRRRMAAREENVPPTEGTDRR